MALDVGILGAGYIADWHCQALRVIPGVRLAAVCDRSASRADKIADRYRIPARHTDLEVMLAAERLDAVHVLLPPEHHCAAAERLLRARLHVLLEKPMALTGRECRHLGRQAEARERTIGVGHNFLFAPVYERLREDVHSGRLGRLESVTIKWHKPLGQIRGGPFGSWLFRRPGNVLLEIGPHPVAALLDLAGGIENIRAEIDRPIDLPNGLRFFRRWSIAGDCGTAHANISLSFDDAAIEHSIHVRGAAGTATADLENGTYVLRRPGDSSLEDADRFDRTTAEGRSLMWQGRGTFARYVLGKFKLSWRGSLYGTSIARAMQSFYEGLTGKLDDRLSAEFGAQVVETCSAIAHVALGDADRDVTPIVVPKPPVAPDVLVLGGTGFIGRAVVRKLLETGRSVRLLTRDPAGLPRTLHGLPLDVVRGDATDAASVETALAGIRDVVHLARSHGETWDDFVRTDIDATRSLAEACLRRKVRRLVYTGTIDSLYSGDRGATINDDTPLDPKIHRRNLYARAKAAAETLLREMHVRQGLPVVIARPGIVIGPGGDPFHWGSGFWPAPYVCRLWGNGEHRLPFVLADDVADAIVRMVEVDGLTGKSFNLVAANGMTAVEYVGAVGKAAGAAIDVRPRSAWRSYFADLAKYAVKLVVRHPKRRWPSYRDWQTRGHFAHFDCSRAKMLLGWQPVGDRATMLREGVDRAVAEWLA